MHFFFCPYFFKMFIKESNNGNSINQMLLIFASTDSPILKMKLNLTAPLSSGVNKKINGYNISGHCGKFLWIRIALLEKLLSKIVEDLHTNARCLYNPLLSWCEMIYSFLRFSEIVGVASGES